MEPELKHVQGSAPLLALGGWMSKDVSTSASTSVPVDQVFK